MRLSLATSILALVIAAAASVAGADSLPGTKSAADRAAWRTVLHWPSSCERSWRAAGAGAAGAAGIGAWPVPGGKRLVEVSCFLGAYQGVSMLYLAGGDRQAVGPLALRAYRDPGSGVPTVTRETQILGTFAFSPRTGILLVLDKFRGVGDCGIYSTFRLATDRFVPVEVRAKTACDGKPPYDPLRWPRLPLPRSS